MVAKVTEFKKIRSYRPLSGKSQLRVVVAYTIFNKDTMLPFHATNEGTARTKHVGNSGSQ